MQDFPGGTPSAALRAMQPAVAITENHLVLGRYRPLRPLGSGGGGSVWLARDEHEGRNVALKVVSREGKPGARAEREVDAATRLRHPRCLRALALSRDEATSTSPIPTSPGRTLREALRGGMLDDWSAVEAAAQVLEALAHAHSKGVVHRDVKPANIMLEDGRRGLDPAPRLRPRPARARRHAHGRRDVPGTLAYIAPERLAGQEASGAADVWAVGVLLGRRSPGATRSGRCRRSRRRAASSRAPSRSPSSAPTSRASSAAPSTACSPSTRASARARSRPSRSCGSSRRSAPSGRRAKTSPIVLRERRRTPRWRPCSRPGPRCSCRSSPGWPFLLGALAAVVALLSPAAGLAVALAVPVLPLGNVSLGLAVAYVPLALLWLLLFARDARSGLLFLAGPLLAPIQRCRSSRCSRSTHGASCARSRSSSPPS